MDCGRCGEPILPGLPTCVACGLTAGELVPEPFATVPRVRTQNPLDRRAPSAAEAAAMRAAARVNRWRGQLGTLDFTGPVAALRGLVPGLGPARRGDRRALGVQLAGLLTAVVLVALTWTSPWNTHAWLLLTFVVGSCAASEAREALDLPEPGRTTSAALFGIAALFAARFAILTVLAAVYPSVDIGGTARLQAGTYFLRPTGDLHAGMLVGIDLHPVGLFPPAQVAVAPIVATAGQTASVVSGAVHVDGVPAPNVTMAQVAVAAPDQPPIVARPGTIVVFLPPRLVPTAVLDVPGELIDSYLPRLVLLPTTEVIGEVTYRWLPAEDRGRVIWPPPE